jgi:hypothetical protein
MSAKRVAPIDLMRNMTSKLFSWECTLPFNTAPRAEENIFVNFWIMLILIPKQSSRSFRLSAFRMDSLWIPYFSSLLLPH